MADWMGACSQGEKGLGEDARELFMVMIMLSNYTEVL